MIAMLRSPFVTLAFGLVGVGLSSGCSSSDESGDGIDLPSQGAGGTTAGDPINLGDGDGDINVGIPPVIPMEEKEDTTFRPPVVTGSYLWSPNPKSGKVALIDAETLSTRILSGGLEPTYLAAVPTTTHDAAAIVLNVGSLDASYFRVSDDTIVTTRISVHEGANQWSISASGRYAVAWSYDPEGQLDPTNGLQEISLLDLSDEVPQARRLTVGFRPSQITFDEAETELIAVSRLGISLVELEGDGSRWVGLETDEGRDVSITRPGGHALVRRAGSSSIDIVSLDDSGDATTLDFTSAVTDLDLAPSGRAVAIIRDESRLATFTVDEILADPNAVDTVQIQDQIVGSAELTDDGLTAVLYTNAIDSSAVTVVALGSGADFLSYTTFDTQSAVASVSVSPDGAHAVAKAKGTEGSSAGSFCLLSLTQQLFPRIIGTKAPILHVDLDNEIGVVTASGGAVHEAYLVSLAALQVDPVQLSSTPISAGVLPGLGMGFAAQDHPEGRVSFFEGGVSKVRTLTGFELSSEIVQE